ncbi:MAG TPA: YetF domain-containing protein [Desulfomonilaceae bacterium]|nr:YetF domain-containing protein [Desulfomonilaceae bacterium]
MPWNLLTPELPILEKIIRPLVVYVFLLLAFRFFGKRELSSISPFDLVILLTISNVLQNAMIGADNSLTGGLIGAGALFGANALFDRLVFYFPAAGNLVQSQVTTLVENGKILKENLDKELLTVEDLRHALRKNQVDLDEELPNIRKVLFEPDGAITIIRKIPESRGLPKRGSRRRKIGDSQK